MLVVGDAFGEPEADLVLRGLDGVGAVDDVAAKLDAVVAADGAGLGGAAGREDGGGGSGSAARRRARGGEADARVGGDAEWRRRHRSRGGEEGTHRGLVAPMILRPVLTTSLPSQTMHTTGPEHM